MNTKKIYVAPAMSEYSMQIENIICTSLSKGRAITSEEGGFEMAGKRRYADEDFDDDFSESIW